MRSFRKNLSLLAAVFVLSATANLALFPGAALSLEGTEIKIGALNSLTGMWSAYGEHVKAGMDIAVEEINAAGGIGGLPIKIIAYDSGTNPDDAVKMAIKLISTDKILVIIGPFSSSQSEATFAVAKRDKIPMITTVASKPGLAAPYRPWAFRAAIATDQLYDPMIKRWVSDNKIKTATIIYDSKERLTTSEGKDVYPKLLAKYGATVADSVSFITGDLDFSAQVTRVKNKAPDGIVLAANHTDGANILRELRRQGLNKPVTGGVAMVEKKLIDLAGKAAEGFFSVTPFWINDPDPKVQGYVKKFMKLMGREPYYISATTYDTVYFLKSVIEKEKITNKPNELELDREKIQKGISSLKGFNGLMGPTSINEAGETTYLKRINLIVKDGKFEIVN